MCPIPSRTKTRKSLTRRQSDPRSALASFSLPERFTRLGAREEQAFPAPLERDAQNVHLIRVHVEEHAIDDAGAAEAARGSRLETDQDGLAEMLHAAGRKRERASVAIADRQRRGHVGSDARLRRLVERCGGDAGVSRHGEREASAKMWTVALTVPSEVASSAVTEV